MLLPEIPQPRQQSEFSSHVVSWNGRDGKPDIHQSIMWYLISGLELAEMARSIFINQVFDTWDGMAEIARSIYINTFYDVCVGMTRDGRDGKPDIHQQIL